MGMIGRLDVSCGRAPIVVVAALVGLCGSLVSCPEDSVKSVSKAGVGITAPAQLPGRIMGLLEENDREFQEDDLELCGLPGVPLASSPSLALSQITLPRSVYLSLLTLAQHPLRC